MRARVQVRWLVTWVLSFAACSSDPVTEKEQRAASLRSQCAVCRQMVADAGAESSCAMVCAQSCEACRDLCAVSASCLAGCEESAGCGLNVAGGDAATDSGEYSADASEPSTDASELPDAAAGDGSTDACADGCQPSVIVSCGDRVLQSGEQCEDGNRTSGDGCSESCQSEGPIVCGNRLLEIGEQCDDGNAARGDGCTEGCRIESFCGDWIKEGDEECDDGDLKDKDGCSHTCTIERAFCGDGVTNQGFAVEECDDGNNVDGDGCTASCRYERLFHCGDLTLDWFEECDDGNRIDNDTCSSTCKLNYRCGDGHITWGVEGCDDGNTVDDISCAADCEVGRCGNGRLDPNEECDDGNRENNDFCSSKCMDTEPCGNGILESTYPPDTRKNRCDDGNRSDGDGCSSRCEREPRCGNGVIDLLSTYGRPEQCDDGNRIDGDGCSRACLREPRCGDGVVDGLTEDCDDGNRIDGDSCRNDCTVPGPSGSDHRCVVIGVGSENAESMFWARGFRTASGANNFRSWIESNTRAPARIEIMTGACRTQNIACENVDAAVCASPRDKGYVGLTPIEQTYRNRCEVRRAAIAAAGTTQESRLYVDKEGVCGDWCRNNGECRAGTTCSVLQGTACALGAACVGTCLPTSDICDLSPRACGTTCTSHAWCDETGTCRPAIAFGGWCLSDAKPVFE